MEDEKRNFGNDISVGEEWSFLGYTTLVVLEELLKSRVILVLLFKDNLRVVLIIALENVPEPAVGQIFVRGEMGR